MPLLFRHHRRLLLLALLLCLALSTLLAVVAPQTVAAQSETGTRSQQLLDQLENGDPLQQEQAAQELAAIGSRSFVPDLTRIFMATDNPRPAATVLGAIGTPAALAVLVDGLSDEALTPRRNAAQLILLEKDVEAVPALVVGLQNRNPLTRRHSAQVLGFIGSPRAGNPLLRAAHDIDAGVRQEAVWALGEIGEARMQPALKAIARSDPDLEVRIEAERAALRVGGGF
ncbi:MAG: HEAT repeat domain-containing protein [Caldilineae bacterium]|nr:HEAT repeat domain-containing protein [Anaerolineae bacterium]MCB0253777.1 HEAT repeat domain-containing protein [Anaerolineae bacterium]MCB9152964.1 HEAT repeat domain-containing protein [Caldilineae bacterium]